MKWTTLVSILAAALGFSVGVRAVAGPPTVRTVEVVTTYPLMPAVSIDQHITTRMERWVSQAAGVSQVESRSLEGISIIRLHFHPNVDLDRALKQVKDLALAVQPNLPPGTLPPVIRTFDPADPSPVGLLALSSDGLNEVEMKNLTRQTVCAELAKIPGAAAPVVLGGKERVTQIFLDARKLEARNLVALDVFKILETSNKNFRAKIASNVFLGGASQDHKLDSKSVYADVDAMLQKADWIVELQPAAKELDKIGNIVIRSAAEGEIRLRDVAVLKEAAVPQTEIIRVGGRHEICILINVGVGADAAAVSKAVRAALPGIEKKLPDKTRLRYVLDRADAARQITLLLRTPSGSLLDTEKLVAEVERFLTGNIPPDQRTAIVSDVGHLDSSETGISSGWNKGPRDATIRVQLSDKAAESAEDIAARLRHRLAKEERFASLTSWFQAGARARPPIRIILTGKDLGELTTIASRVRTEAAGAPGAADALLCESPLTPAITISVDREKAAALGLTTLDLARQAAAALGAPPTQPLDLIRDQVTIPVKPKINYEEVLNSPVSSPRFKQPVPLRNLVQLSCSLVPAEITHVDLQRAINVWVNVDGPSAAEVADSIEARVKRLELPKGVAFKIIRD